ncbi:MAG: type 4a pilus biogenesis protein PilO [Candidatus Omnitrophica bacterium]|nr:type 4a pilus biogenesis protein PilO [Candidatus Omnitrophota bacterium]
MAREIDKNTIINLGFVLIGIIISVYIYNQNTKEIKSLEFNQEQEKKRNAALLGISELEKRIDVYKRLLPKKEASAIINELTSFAQSAGVQVVSVRPSEEKITSYCVLSPFDVVINALDYHAVGRFVSSIESSKDVYLVDNVNIRNEGQRTKGLVANLKVTSVALAEQGQNEEKKPY